MPDYRLYFDDAKGHFMRAVVVDVADDEAAPAKAREMDHAHCIEVWQRTLSNSSLRSSNMKE